MISPLLSNLYLSEVDRLLEKAIAITRFGQYTRVEYARFADDMVLLIDSHPRQDWLVKAVARRVREGNCQAKLKVEINEEKSRMVDLSRSGESFCFLGFEVPPLSEANSESGGPSMLAQAEKADGTGRRKLKIVFRRCLSQPVGTGDRTDQPNSTRLGELPSRPGHSSQCFSFISQWVERKIRRHLMRAQGRQVGSGGSSGVKTGSTTRSGCFHGDYRVRWQRA